MKDNSTKKNMKLWVEFSKITDRKKIHSGSYILCLHVEHHRRKRQTS